MASHFQRQPALSLTSLAFITDNSALSKLFIEQCFTKAHNESNETVISFLNQVATTVGYQQLAALQNAIEQLKPSNCSITDISNSADHLSASVTADKQPTKEKVEAIAAQFNIDGSNIQHAIIPSQEFAPNNLPLSENNDLAMPTDVGLSRVVGKFNI